MTEPSPHSTERRRFNASERVALYLAADGNCQRCGTPLQAGWHGDHIEPYSLGGPTDVINGQALCPTCNLRKGATPVAYADQFKPREFQTEVIKSVLDGISSGRRTTVVLASPGSGKTLTYQAVATYLYREGLIDYVGAFVPRIVLARQCELSWHRRLDQPDGISAFDGDHRLFDPRARIGPIRHIPNKLPLLPPGESGIGFVTTYSALVKAPLIFSEGWARKHKGRFLLVADEAQFCGTNDDDNDSGGTAAGRWMKELHEYAAHTLLLTGTPYRSDGQPLILADYEPAGEDGMRRLVHHAEASYATGIAESYLRRFEAELHDARVRVKYASNEAVEYDLSISGADLKEVVRKPDVWQPICRDVVRALREKQKIYAGYRALISCMQQPEARLVQKFLAKEYPDLKVMISVSDDGADAEQALRDFKSGGADVLVTVRKAFIGYDCPEITVVGVLTNYRDQGHLFQLVGRGLRILKDGPDRRAQSCRVICPDDPQMQQFVDMMRGESEQGMRERERREKAQDGAELPSKSSQPELSWVESAHSTAVRGVSNDAEVDADEMFLIKAVKHELGLSDDATSLKLFIERIGMTLSQGSAAAAGAELDGQILLPATSAGTPKTEREHVEDLNRQAAKSIKSFVARQGYDVKDSAVFGKQVMRVTAAVNAAAGFTADEVRTVDDAMARLRAVERLTLEVAA